MTIRTSLALAFLLSVILLFALFVDWIGKDLKPSTRAALEESLVDAAEVLAATVTQFSSAESLNTSVLKQILENAESRKVNAQIYDFLKDKFDLRIYVTDSRGIIIFDSTGQDVGKDYSKWRDVHLTLRGQYGSRTSRRKEEDPATSSLYVATPIIINSEIQGVLTVGKPALQSNAIIDKLRRRLILGGIVAGALSAVIILLFTTWVTAPLQRLRDQARAVRDGQNPPPLRALRGEMREVAEAFEQMRETLEGKKYVEQYIQTLTHELKSPLTAIRASAELLQENPTPADAGRFLEHIQNESRRIQEFVDNLLSLAALEAKRELPKHETVELTVIVKNAMDAAAGRASQRSVSLVCDLHGNGSVSGNAALLQLALSNLLHNALDFAPSGSKVEVRTECEETSMSVSIRDFGPGIPAFAEEKIFDRFYSLPRPSSQKKSSGLGLSIVKQIMELHGGSVTVRNAEGGGVVAEMNLPRG